MSDSHVVSEEREEEAFGYRHRHIDIDISKKKERRFYVPKHLEQTFIVLEEILRREGSSLSAWIQRNAVDYVRLHEPGNPQQRLDTIMKNGKAYRAPIHCNVPHCNRKATHSFCLVAESNRSLHVCELHAKDFTKSDKWMLNK